MKDAVISDCILLILITIKLTVNLCIVYFLYVSFLYLSMAACNNR